MNKIQPSSFLLGAFIYTLLCFIMPPFGHNYDMGCWTDWAVHIYEHGLSKAYNSSINYLPGHLYELSLYTLLFDTKEEIVSNIYYLKYFTLLFDVAGSLLVCSFAKKASMQQLLLMVLLLNPAYLHNTMIWGQFDSVFSCFVFAAFIALYKSNYLLCSVLYLLSLNFKFQAIVFLPALLLLSANMSGWKLKATEIAKGAFLLIIVQTIILSPFIYSGSASKVWDTLKGLSGEDGYISLQAANIWYWLLKGDLRWTSDATLYYGLSLKTWGLLMFLSSLIISLSPLLVKSFQKKSASPNMSIEKLLLSLSLAPLCFFYFNTQMHERYSYPAFLFIAAYAFATSSWWLYGFFSLAYFLNTDKIMECITKVNYQSYLFDFKNISLLFGVLICVHWYLLYFKKTESKSSSL